MGLGGRIAEQWGWLTRYSGRVFADDLVASVVVTILLVPQCLAYALLAGLPAQVGIYASILPLVAYALLGSSNYLNVGPTAVISLMTAAIIATLPAETRLVSAAALALMTGAMLIVAGLFRAGFIMNFVSRPVVSAYITGAALLIIFSQLKHLLGMEVQARTAFGIIRQLWGGVSDTHIPTLIIGVLASAAFLFVKGPLPYLLVKSGVRARLARLIGRMAPIVIIGLFVVVSAVLALATKYGVAEVGDVPLRLWPL